MSSTPAPSTPTSPAGFGRIPGVGAAFVALYGYLAMGLGLYGGLGVVASGFLDSRFGVTVHWWLCALVGLLVVGVLGLMRVDINGKVLAFLLVTEIAIAVVFDIIMVRNPAETGITLETLSPGLLLTWAAGAAPPSSRSPASSDSRPPSSFPRRPAIHSARSPAPPTSPSQSPASCMGCRRGPCPWPPARITSLTRPRRTALN